MDKMLRIPQIFHQRPEFLIAVDEDIHIIVLRQHGFSGLQIIHDQILIPPDILIQLLDIPGSQPVLLLSYIFADVILHLFDPEHFPLMHILPQQQIEHEPQYRYKIQQKQPCPHTLWIPSLKKHDHDGKQHIKKYQMAAEKIYSCFYDLKCFTHNTAPSDEKHPFSSIYHNANLLSSKRD